MCDKHSTFTPGCDECREEWNAYVDNREYGSYTHTCEECGDQMPNDQVGVCSDCQSQNGDSDVSE